MLFHTVFFWLKPDVSAEDEARFASEVAQLLTITEIAAGHAGHPAGTEAREVTDHSFHTSLHLQFASQADHDAYQVHPEHHRFVDACKDLWAQVKVYDSQVG